MLCYIVDEGYDGYLTALFEAMATEEKPGRILFEMPRQDMLDDDYRLIPRDPGKAKRLFTGIEKRMNQKSLDDIEMLYFSGINHAPTVAWGYLQHGFSKTGKKAGDPRIARAQRIIQSVAWEVQHLTGQIEFRLLVSGVYYASIKPRHNILKLLSPAFVDRLHGASFILHDCRRMQACLYNGEQLTQAPFDKIPRLIFEGEEKLYNQLWLDYFLECATEATVNPRLLEQIRPPEYWQKHIKNDLPSFVSG
ncbi:MAG: TIGR03915 family putative DNA repair protein [Christensenellales bacterium]|jgi:probable DNA metabolism protein